MRKAAGIEVGDIANVKIEFDPEPRITPMHPGLLRELAKNKNANSAFEKLTPSRQKEIMRYIGFLKTEESLAKNIEKVIKHLSGKGSFIGRD